MANLVPACGPCNQSKSGNEWRNWINSSAKGSPASRGVPNIPELIAKLEAFENWRQPTKLDFAALIPPDKWSEHWANHDALLGMMRDAQATAEAVRDAAIAALAI